MLSENIGFQMAHHGWKVSLWNLHDQSRKHEHRGEIDSNDRLEVVVLVVVGAEADDVEDGGREEDVGGDGDQLPRQDELHLHRLRLLLSYSHHLQEQQAKYITKYWPNM